MAHGTLVITRAEVGRVLRMRDCIAAVESAFLPARSRGNHSTGRPWRSRRWRRLPREVGRSAGLGGREARLRGKVNANFPGNPDRHGLPTIQGVIALFDAGDGRLLALLDSIEITSLRTAAATAVAAKYLAPEAGAVTICGCGEQARSQLRALACVRSITRVMALDLNADRATRFAADMAAELGVDVSVIREPGDAARDTSIWVTCTPARRWFLGRDHVAAGAFVAAVGADNPEKQEIEPELLAGSAVVVDVLEQCATIGDLHHAIASGLMRREDVRAELAEVVSGQKAGRLSRHEIIVFDSTGTALQDVAAAALVYERALASGAGLTVDLGAA